MANLTMSPGRKPGSNPLTLAVLAGAWIASFGNWPLWRTLSHLPEMASPRGALFMIGFGVMIAALVTGLLALLAWRHTIKPAIAFVVLSAAVGAHFMGAYGVVLDTTMMTNVLQTNAREAADLLSLQFLLSLLLLAALPLAWLWRRPVQRLTFVAQSWRNVVTIVGALLLIAALVGALYADLSSTMRNHRSVRYLVNPVNSFWALGVIAKNSTARPAGPLQTIGLDAHAMAHAASDRPPLLVLVVGETARADHFALNGYARPTNPELSREDVISFTDVTSCGTNTAASLPCMFSALGRTAFNARDRDQENLLDLVQRAGMAVLWIDNQSGCKGLCDRVPNAMAGQAPAGAAPRDPSLCEGGECLDEALLVDLDRRIDALPADRRARGTLVVLHQMGSHGPAYFKRSPDGRKPFMPECSSPVLRECDRSSLMNAYDNTIAYTDHVLAKTIAWLKTQSGRYRPIMVYVSDHGESLGENNIYLHGLPYALAPKEQTHVPLIAWFGTGGSAAETPTACLRLRRNEPLTHDHLFHTVLGLLNIQAAEYRRSLDAFAPCMKP
jgi:lipid A ethanolaminephosphotransferase